MNKTIFGITGWKDSGKTTLTERLVSLLSQRGWRVATVKHAHHSFDIDHVGTDSYRHRKAGAAEVAIVSQHRWAIMHEIGQEKEPELSEIISRLSPCDLILVEGYKHGSHPKIEVRRQNSPTQQPLDPIEYNIAAVATDQAPVNSPDAPQAIPFLNLNDIEQIADFIELHCGLTKTV